MSGVLGLQRQVERLADILNHQEHPDYSWAKPLLALRIERAIASGDQETLQRLQEAIERMQSRYA